MIEDFRAKRRKYDAPDMVRLTYLDNDDTLETIAHFANWYPAPAALVLANGQVMVLADGGKGGIAVQGVQGQETPEASAALAVVADVFSRFYGLPAPKAKSEVAPDAPGEPLSDPDPAGDTVAPDPAEDGLDGLTEANGEE